MTVNPYREPQTVLLDGKIMDEPLSTLGLNRAWLFNELEKIGVNPENVFIGQVDSMGELYLDLFDDTIQLPQPTSKQLLLSTLKKVEADLMKYSLETEDEQWKSTYAAYAKQVKEIIVRLEPFLNT